LVPFLTAAFTKCLPLIAQGIGWNDRYRNC
jgi:hypothetical protein